MYNTTFNTVLAKKLKFVHAKPRVSKIATIKYSQLTLRAPWATLVDKNFLPLSTTGDFSQHEERAAYRYVKRWPLSALVT